MTFQFHPAFLDATNEQKWDQIKLWRNAELVRTDWTQVADAPVDQSAWATYRQALRDLPAQGGSADEAKFPNEPAAKS
jgi:phage terminase small subunit